QQAVLAIARIARDERPQAEHDFAHGLKELGLQRIASCHLRKEILEARGGFLRAHAACTPETGRSGKAMRSADMWGFRCGVGDVCKAATEVALDLGAFSGDCRAAGAADPCHGSRAPDSAG